MDSKQHHHNNNILRYDATKKHHKSNKKIFQKKNKIFIDFLKIKNIYYKKKFIMKKGTKHTEQAKQKISAAMKGRTFTDEARKKIGEGISKWYAENANSQTEINRRAKLSVIGKERMRVWNEYVKNQINNLNIV